MNTVLLSLTEHVFTKCIDVLEEIRSVVVLALEEFLVRRNLQ